MARTEKKIERGLPIVKIRILALIRDALLLKPMSGEIKIKDAVGLAKVQI